ncbi:MAG: hypothetical protein N2423_10475 [Novosphingobium sp.]|nr:hypothetical protein [Novosphingobium sp.]
MPSIRKMVLAGAATFLFAGAAVAATSNLHTMHIDLPDGSVARIHYSGDVAPKVEIRQVATRAPASPDAIEAVMFPQFTGFDRIAAMLDAQRQAMLSWIAQLQRQAFLPVVPADLMAASSLPGSASVGFSFTSVSNGKTVCTQSVEWRSDGSGSRPTVTRASSGDCEALGTENGQKVVPVMAPVTQAEAAGGANAI